MNKKTVFTILVVLICAAGIYVITQWVRSSSRSKLVQEVSAGINERCPTMVDLQTRLDSTSVTESSALKYYYTIIIPKDSVQTQIPEVEKQLSDYLLNMLKTSPEMKFLLDSKIIFEYTYQDSNGEAVADIKITPDMYK